MRLLASIYDVRSRLIHGVGYATWVFLPAWGSLLGIRIDLAPWYSVLDIAVSSVVIALFYASVFLLKSRWRYLVLSLFWFLIIFFGYDTIAYIYDGLRAALIDFGLLDRYKIVFKAGVIVFIGFFIGLMLFRRSWLRAAFNVIPAYFAVVFVIFCVQFSWQKLFSSAPDSVGLDRATQSKQATVVLVFDELDADFLADNIGEFPAFARLNSNASVAGSLYPPSNYTHISLPSMLMGVPLNGSEVFGSKLIYTTKGSSDKKILGYSDTFFSGFGPDKISVIGWHLPYCGIFKNIRRCLDDEAYSIPGGVVSSFYWLYAKNSFLFRARNRSARKEFENIDVFTDLFFRDVRSIRQNHLGDLLAGLERRLDEDVASKRYDLIFAHLPCPHLPRSDGLKSQGIWGDYRANLQRCDQMVARVFDGLSHGGYDGYRLIVTSDHWFRVRDWIDNKKIGSTPSIVRKVPFFYFESHKHGDRVLIRDGSNIGLDKILKEISKGSVISPLEILPLVSEYGSESTFLDRF